MDVISQGGNILMTPNVTSNLKALFIIVKYPGTSNRIITLSQAQQHAANLSNLKCGLISANEAGEESVPGRIFQATQHKVI